MKDLDTELAGMKFDMEAFEKTVNRTRKYVRMVLHAYNLTLSEDEGVRDAGERRIKRLAALDERNSEILEKMLEPVIDKMVERGYSTQELFV